MSKGLFLRLQTDTHIIKELLKFIRSSIPVTIEITSDIRSDALVLGNATQLHQVMMNLCTNAAHAMEQDGGILNVTLKEAEKDEISDVFGNGSSLEKYIRITVSDTGTGIDPKIIGSIFEPYFTTNGHALAGTTKNETLAKLKKWS